MTVIGSDMATNMRCKTRPGRGDRTGFTLVEMVVVIFLITLMAGVALPGIITLFSSGADSQAYNVLAAEITMARAMAIQYGMYAGVHVQLADKNANPSLENACYAAVMFYDPTIGKFTTDAGQGRESGVAPRRIPGAMAFGELRSSGSPVFVTNNAATPYTNLASDSNLRDFTSFTIVFSPTGTVVRKVNNNNVVFDPNDPLFAGSKRLWSWTDTGSGAGEPGATAVTMFDYTRLLSSDDRSGFLNDSGQFIPVNVYTGQLFPRR